MLKAVNQKSRGSLRVVGADGRSAEGDDDLEIGGSWVVISGVISRATTSLTHIRGLITQLMTTHKPPSRIGSLKRKVEQRYGQQLSRPCLSNALQTPV